MHIDVKKLGRIKGGAGKRVGGGVRRHNFARVTDAAGPRRLTVGWEYVHVCVDARAKPPSPAAPVQYRALGITRRA